MKRLFVIALSGIQCSPRGYCEVSVVPFTGQSNVPLDGRIVINYIIPDAHPVMKNHPALIEVETGEEVEVVVEFDPRLILVPVEPLKSDTEYMVFGGFGNDSRHYIKTSPLSDEPRYTAESYFSTASHPTIL